MKFGIFLEFWIFSLLGVKGKKIAILSGKNKKKFAYFQIALTVSLIPQLLLHNDEDDQKNKNSREHDADKRPQKFRQTVS